MSDEEPRARFQLVARVRSFAYAAAGIREMLQTEHNAWIHALATLVVVCAGFAFGVSALEWCVLVLAATLVWSAEGLNSAVELLADAAVPEEHALVGKAKDVAAGAVLLAAIGATIVAAIVFVPRVATWLGA